MISIQKIEERAFAPKYKVEFLIDSDSDIADLPTSTKEGAYIELICAPGSVAYTADMANIFMLGNNDEWCAWQ